MTSVKYIGMDVHTESTSIAVRNSLGKIVMEGVIETKANTILQFLDGLRGDLRVVFEEGTWATWLYDLLKSHVTEVLVCNTRKNAVRKGSKSDRIDARKLAEQLYTQSVDTPVVSYEADALCQTRPKGPPQPKRGEVAKRPLNEDRRFDYHDIQAARGCNCRC